MDQLLPLKRVAIGALMAIAAFAPSPPAHASEPFVANAFGGPCVQAFPQKLLAMQECTGEAVLQGSLNGRVHFHAWGWVDPLTGDAAGRFAERFEGRSADLRRKGRLWMSGSFEVDGETGTLTAKLRITGGDGGFRHARGDLEAWGYMPITTGPQIGSYFGAWEPTAQ